MRADGYIIVVEPDRPTFEADTAQCVHCEKHWMIQRGSGIRRGFCLRCSGPTCGSARCQRCLPFEAQLEASLRREALAKAMGLCG